MQISQCMTRDVKLVAPQDTIQKAACAMAEVDSGILPVSDGERLVGLITDRDIAIRGVGAGCAADTPVQKVMSAEVRYCFEDEDVEEVLDNMADLQIRRLPVLDRDKRLVGIVSLSDLADREADETGRTLADIARPSRQHSHRSAVVHQ